jgi:hypothetical protein
MKSLPPGPWEVLFERALRLLDDIQRHGGLADPFWTFGGGTVLMFRYGHSLSNDIDIFVPDPQYLGYVTPRLSDTAASLTEEYTEMPGSFVKLQFEEGEIDFVAAPNLTDVAWERWEIQGRQVRVETVAEVVAKKMYHRGDRATARDLFDLAMVVEREPDALAAAAPFPHAAPRPVPGADRATWGRVRGDFRGDRCDRVSAEPGALRRGCHRLFVRVEGPLSLATLRATRRTARTSLLTVSSRPMWTRGTDGGTDGGTVGFLLPVFSMRSTA